MFKKIFMLLLTTTIVLSACGTFEVSINQKIQTPTTPIVDPTKNALEIEATSMSAFVTQQAAPPPALQTPFSETPPINDNPSSNPVPLTLDMLKNAEYHSAVLLETIRLENGIYYLPLPPLPPGESQNNWFITMRSDDLIVFGDINADGIEDAAVILYSQRGGTGRFVELAAVVNQNGEPYNIASVSLGDREIVNSVNIQNGEIILDMIVHGPTDPLLSGSLKAILKFKLSGMELVKLAGP
jgi:hypothetical protein